MLLIAGLVPVIIAFLLAHWFELLSLLFLSLILDEAKKIVFGLKKISESLKEIRDEASETLIETKVMSEEISQNFTEIISHLDIISDKDKSN
jgi:hypothetical protein